MDIKNLAEVNKLHERLKSLREIQTIFNDRYSGKLECTISCLSERGRAVAVIEKHDMRLVVTAQIDKVVGTLKGLGVEL